MCDMTISHSFESRQSRLTYEWVSSFIWVGHVTHRTRYVVNKHESCHACGGDSATNYTLYACTCDFSLVVYGIRCASIASRGQNAWVMPRVWMSHVAVMRARCIAPPLPPPCVHRCTHTSEWVLPTHERVKFHIWTSHTYKRVISRIEKIRVTHLRESTISLWHSFFLGICPWPSRRVRTSHVTQLCVGAIFGVPFSTRLWTVYLWVCVCVCVCAREKACIMCIYICL